MQFQHLPQDQLALAAVDFCNDSTYVMASSYDLPLCFLLFHSSGPDKPHPNVVMVKGGTFFYFCLWLLLLFLSDGSGWNLSPHKIHAVNVSDDANGHLFVLEKSYLSFKALLKCDLLCEAGATLHLHVREIMSHSGVCVCVCVSLHVGPEPDLLFVPSPPFLHSLPSIPGH